MTEYKLGINCGFAINRYPEPGVWTKLVGEEFNLNYVQFVADLLNPFLPDDIIGEQVNEIKKYIKKYEITVDSTFTSAFTRVNHLLHPDKKQREVWLQWFKDFYDISASLGARASGSHFGILSMNDCYNKKRKKELLAEAVDSWKELALYGKEIGFEYIMFEPMSVPRELGWTIEETKTLLHKVNKNNEGVPMMLCLDIGHAPHPEERDPYLWCKELGAASPTVHIQQTEAGHSRHWPFTEEYNKKGIIDPEKVMKALDEGGAGKVMFLFEISHREKYPIDLKVVDDLKKSVEYWKKYL
ncbi:MAG: sugar phosphate isomerase/epimerase family protein [Halanaerobiaceae bacterium]